MKWLQMIDKYWYGGDITYSSSFGFWRQCLFQYNDELPIDETTESACLKWKLEQHKLTPKYDILYSFVPPVKSYHVTYVYD